MCFAFVASAKQSTRARVCSRSRQPAVLPLLRRALCVRVAGDQSACIDASCPPRSMSLNELTESFDHWEGRFLRDLSSHRRRSVRGGRLGLVKGCPHVLHAAWLWPPSGHAWQPETACGGTVTRLSDTQRSNFCCALHSWQAQSRARAPVCAPVRVKAGLRTSAPAQTDFHEQQRAP